MASPSGSGGYGPDWVVAPADGWVAPKGRTPDGRVVAAEGRRVIGYLIDLAIWSVPQMLVIGGAVVAFLLSIPDDSSEDPSGPGLVVAILLYGLAFLLGLLRLVIEAEKVARSGQTWGMRLAHLRVVDGKTGGSITRGRAWGRAAFAVFVSGQVFGFGYWWAFFDDRNRTLHDLVCTTVVIDER